MDKENIKKSIAYCGLICELCQPKEICNCKSSNNHCGKRLSKEGCYQYNCCLIKKIDGCWECEEFPCDKDMLKENNIKIRAFIRCIKEDGIEKFAECIIKNKKDGIVYHRKGIYGDYDLENEEDVLKLLREGINL